MSVPLRAIEGRGENVLRQQPLNLDAERGLLGAIMLNNRSYERVSEFLAPGMFAEQLNGRIYYAAGTLIERGNVANTVSLQTALATDDLLLAAGGSKYLAALAGNAATIINAGEYGKIIYETYQRRELIALGEDVVNDAYDADLNTLASDLIDKAETQLFSLRKDGTAQGDLVDFDSCADVTIDLAERAYRHDGSLIGVTTGLRDLDRKLGGLQNSDLLILGGRPSSGKTALATTIAVNAAKSFQNTGRDDHKGKQVAFFSLEMSRDQLLVRVFSERAGLDSFAVKTGNLSSHEFSALELARQEMRGLPLRIDDSAGATVAQIRSRARRLARKGALGLIVIDYLQLISSPAGQGRPENRVNEVSAITRGLKMLAKELNVPVIALSQLSRGLEQREDKRPQLSDLRESGSVEQDADVVLFVYRDEYYLERAEPKQRADEAKERHIERMSKWQQLMENAAGKGEVIVAKQRQGPLGTVTLNFMAKCAHWSDVEREAEQQQLI